MESIYSLHRHFTEYGPLPNSLALTFDDFIRFGYPHSGVLPVRASPHQLNPYFRDNPAFRWVPLSYSQTKIPEILPEGRKWFYELDFCHGMAADSSLFKTGEYGIWKSIPDDIRNDIWHGKGKLLISSIIEDSGQQEIYNLFWALGSSGANLRNVVLLTSAFHNDRFVSDVERDFGATLLRAPVWENYVERWDREQSRRYLKTNDWARVRKKRFLFLNRRIAQDCAHRVLAFLFLLKEDLLEHGFASMPWNCLDNPGATLHDRLVEFRHRHSGDGNLMRELLDFGYEFYKEGAGNLPLNLDIDFQDNSQRIWNGRQDYLSNSVCEYFSESYFSVVGECFFGLSPIRKAYLISEKTISAMMNFHPFLLLAEPFSLHRIKQQGYRTFPKMFDESYDEIEDPDRRLKAVGNELRRLCSMPPEKLRELYASQAPILEYNRRQVLSRLTDFPRIFRETIDA